MISQIRKRTIYITLASILGVIIIIGIVISSYIHGLIDLVATGEVEGDPSFQESNMYETNHSEPDTTIPSGSDQIGESAEPTETIIETTKDPRIVEIEKQNQEALNIPLRNDNKVQNILLIGSDRREGEANGRSDTMIIFSINKRTHKIHIVSLMRAMYVNIPDRGFSMLHAAYSYGGSKLLRQTIEKNLRIRVDDYVMIDFSGFESAINTIGGLDINLTVAEANELNYLYATTYTEGANFLDGAMVLAYSRIRHIDSDFARTGRQRYVIETLIKKMMTLGPSDLDALARSILPMVKTNMDSGEMIGLAIGALDFRDYTIRQMMLPIKNSYNFMYFGSMEVVKFDYQDNIEALQDFLYDD